MDLSNYSLIRRVEYINLLACFNKMDSNQKSVLSCRTWQSVVCNSNRNVKLSIKKIIILHW